MQNKPPHDLIVPDGRAANTVLTLGRITQAFTQPGSSFITLIKLHIIKEKKQSQNTVYSARARTHTYPRTHITTDNKDFEY